MGGVALILGFVAVAGVFGWHCHRLWRRGDSGSVAGLLVGILGVCFIVFFIGLVAESKGISYGWITGFGTAALIFFGPFLFGVLGAISAAHPRLGAILNLLALMIGAMMLVQK